MCLLWMNVIIIIHGMKTVTKKCNPSTLHRQTNVLLRSHSPHIVILWRVFFLWRTHKLHYIHILVLTAASHLRWTPENVIQINQLQIWSSSMEFGNLDIPIFWKKCGLKIIPSSINVTHHFLWFKHHLVLTCHVWHPYL
jgi:hypothetical protein